MKVILSFLLSIFLMFFPIEQALAGAISERVANFPNWQTKALLKPALGDLIYPDWMAGNWSVSSVLVDMIAPLAPTIITPGFSNNQKYLNTEQNFTVRFLSDSTNKIVADRVFNGLSIAASYLGKEAVLAVKQDPKSVNQQVTILAKDRRLISIVTRRLTEEDSEQFLATELSQQIFKTGPQMYLNEVETTTVYHPINEQLITAEQYTAIYLSPQDPDYFKAINRPVALYHYSLKLTPIAN